MKKLLGLAAFVVAFAPFAYAQNNAAQYGYPDAINNRPVEMHEHTVIRHKHHRMHHVKHHHAMSMPMNK